MRERLSRLLSLTAILAALGVAAAGAATTHWSGITRVTAKSLNGSLPPAGKDIPDILSFTSAAQLAKVTAALNANHIAYRSGPGDPGGCAGGVNVTITIAQRTKKITLTAYLCGDKTYGTIGGNVRGFVKAVGLKLQT
jgi:hypothetical protein